MKRKFPECITDINFQEVRKNLDLKATTNTGYFVVNYSASRKRIEHHTNMKMFGYPNSFTVSDSKKLFYSYDSFYGMAVDATEESATPMLLNAKCNSSLIKASLIVETPVKVYDYADCKEKNILVRRTTIAKRCKDGYREFDAFVVKVDERIDYEKIGIIGFLPEFVDQSGKILKKETEKLRYLMWQTIISNPLSPFKDKEEILILLYTTIYNNNEEIGKRLGMKKETVKNKKDYIVDKFRKFMGRRMSLNEILILLDRSQLFNIMLKNQVL